MANGDTIKAIRGDILSRTSKHRRRRKKLEWHTIWWTGKGDDVTPVRANGKNKKQFRYCCLFSFFFSLDVIAVEFFPGREFVTMRELHRKRAVSDGMTMTSRWVAGDLCLSQFQVRKRFFCLNFDFIFNRKKRKERKASSSRPTSESEFSIKIKGKKFIAFFDHSLHFSREVLWNERGRGISQIDCCCCSACNFVSHTRACRYN
jgi:hypothetical protein